MEYGGQVTKRRGKKKKLHKREIPFSLEQVQSLCILTRESVESFEALKILAKSVGLEEGRDYTEHQELCAKLLQMFDVPTLHSLPNEIIMDIALRLSPEKLASFVKGSSQVRRLMIKYRNILNKELFKNSLDVQTDTWKHGLEIYLQNGNVDLIHLMLDLGYEILLGDVKLDLLYYPVNVVEVALIRSVYADGDYVLLDLLLSYGFDGRTYRMPDRVYDRTEGLILYVLSRTYFTLFKPYHMNPTFTTPLWDTTAYLNESDAPINWGLLFHMADVGIKIQKKDEYQFALTLLYQLHADSKRTIGLANVLHIDFNIQGEHNFTPFLYVIDVGFFDVARDVLTFEKSLGIDVDVRDSFGRNALFLTAISTLPGSPDFLFDLFKRGISPLGEATIPMRLVPAMLLTHIDDQMIMTQHQQSYERLKKNYDLCRAYLFGYANGSKKKTKGE